VIKAIESKKVSCYVTDFPEDKLLGIKGVIPIPHLGASTAESEENCAVMAVDEIKAYLEDGNIINSVNFPNCSLPKRSGDKRLIVANENKPNMIGNITNLLAKNNINIDDMLNKSRGDLAYNIIDISGNIGDDLVKSIEELDGVLFAKLV